MSVLLLNNNFRPFLKLLNWNSLRAVHEQKPLNLTQNSEIHLAIKQSNSAARETIQLLYLLLSQLFSLVLHILNINILDIINILFDQFLEYGFENIEILKFLVRIELEFILTVGLCFLPVVLDHALDRVLPICLREDVLGRHLVENGAVLFV